MDIAAWELLRGEVLEPGYELRDLVRMEGAGAVFRAAAADIVDAGGRKQMGEVMSGGSYYSQNSMTLYFGLGAAEKIDRIELRWPSGITQILSNSDASSSRESSIWERKCRW